MDHIFEINDVEQTSISHCLCIVTSIIADGLGKIKILATIERILFDYTALSKFGFVTETSTCSIDSGKANFLNVMTLAFFDLRLEAKN